MDEKCTNTSSPPSRPMKPKPLVALNHLTVPTKRSSDMFFLSPARNDFSRFPANGGIKRAGARLSWLRGDVKEKCKCPVSEKRMRNISDRTNKGRICPPAYKVDAERQQ